MNNANPRKLADVPAGELVTIGDHEMIVLEQTGSETMLLRKDLLVKNRSFGENNNYNGSSVDGICNEFAKEIAAVVGEENVVLHDVDLTSHDGLKDYGTIQRKASLLTTALAQRFVALLDKFKLDAWWWLATPWSTPAHCNDCWVLCVSPSGSIDGILYCCGSGVRPFCILKSNIFVS